MTKKMFQSELSGLGFLFIPIFSSLRRPTFQEIEILRLNRYFADNPSANCGAKPLTARDFAGSAASRMAIASS